MKDENKQLILRLAQKQITLDEFLQQFPVDLTTNKKYILQVLEYAFESKKADDVEYALLLGFSINAFSREHTLILCKLLCEEWHYKHEDIVLILQKLKDPSSIECLYKSTLMRLSYLDYDESHALARKAIHALADINTDEAKEKLRLLAQSDVPIIKEKAQKQLHYYRR